MNSWLILVGQPGPASNRNSAGKAQPPSAVIGGRFPPDPFLRGALPEVGFGVTGGQCLTGGERQLRVGLASSTAFGGTPAIGAKGPADPQQHKVSSPPNSDGALTRSWT